MSKIVVIGSANIDTIHEVDELPTELTKESVNGIKSTDRALGGKGANQAVSAVLQSEGTENEVYFIGCVGQDEAGFEIIQNLKGKGINYSGVSVLNGETTDGRIVFVDKDGNNQMWSVGGGCIKKLTPEMVFKGQNKMILFSADMIMIQMKMPNETTESIIEFCQQTGKPLLIDPTPLEKSGFLIEKGLIDDATFLTPNEEEAFALAMYEEGRSLEEANLIRQSSLREERIEAIRKLVERHPNIIATLGDRGVMYKDGDSIKEIGAYPTNCIDSTGAGDTFNGAFMAALARRESLENAIRFALTDCAHKVQFKGAQNGMQTYSQTLEDMKKMDKEDDLEL